VLKQRHAEINVLTPRTNCWWRVQCCPAALKMRYRRGQVLYIKNDTIGPLKDRIHRINTPGRVTASFPVAFGFSVAQLHTAVTVASTICTFYYANYCTQSLLVCSSYTFRLLLPAIFRESTSNVSHSSSLSWMASHTLITTQSLLQVCIISCRRIN
jgi:hypothetical protein